MHDYIDYLCYYVTMIFNYLIRVFITEIIGIFDHET